MKEIKHIYAMKVVCLLGLLLASSHSSMSIAQEATRIVPTEKDMKAYLFVFHTDPTHSLHMATSRDGNTFTAVNDGNPVIAGDTIAF